VDVHIVTAAVRNQVKDLTELERVRAIVNLHGYKMSSEVSITREERNVQQADRSR